jgi:chromate reductase, NAD(P)H dehydrogenase (quinone)
MSIKILALPGSLRSNSSSNVVLNSLQHLVAPDVSIYVYDSIGMLPHFDDSDPAPAAVVDFRKQLKEADAILICTPEYAFGVPGSLKNALDWTVSSGEFVDKPVALITASSNGEYGHAALLLILKAISAKVTDETSLLIRFVRSKIDKQGEITDSIVKDQLRDVLAALVKNV